MAWVYLDDQFPDHPKIAAAGGDAAWLFVCGLAYVKRYATEGQIPKGQIPKLSDRRAPRRLAQRLVDVGLWENGGDHYRVHDYHDWNKPQESRSAAARKAARARWGNRRDEPPPDANAYADAMPDADEPQSEPDASPDASECPPPPPTDDNKGGENLRAAADAVPPPRKCPAHSDVDHPPPCGACADARRAHDTWQQNRGGSATNDHFDHRLDDQQQAMLAKAGKGIAVVHAIINESPPPADLVEDGFAAARGALRRQGPA